MIEFTKEDIFLVTGASSGIGKGVALLLNELGATVVGIGRNVERLNSLKTEAKNPENLYIEAKELTENIDSLPLFVKDLKEKYGKFRGLICCAGINLDSPLRMLSLELAQKQIETNYLVPMFMAKGFADKRNHKNENASIVFIASISAFAGEKSQAIYGATKAGLIASTKTLSNELAPNVRVNSISPGSIDTPMLQNSIKMLGKNDILNNTPLGIGSPKDIACLVAFLVSDCAKWITGENYIIDGGGF